MNPNVTLSSKTKLLDLPNELLSRIIHFTIPQATVCPLPPSPPLDSTNVAFTCKRLYNLVKRRLSTLDFLSPASPLTHMVRVPRADNDTIENFTRIASPFLEVLRLPTDFRPMNTDMSSMGCCRNLKELAIPITYDISPKGAENFLIPLKKLESFTITNPRTPVFEVINMTSWKLRQLSIISVTATSANFKILERILKMGTLESLTVTFECSGKNPVINQYNRDEPHNTVSFPETLQFVSEMLHRNAPSLKALTKLSIATVDRNPRERTLKDDGKDVNRMVDEINTLRRIIDNTREYAVDHLPHLNLAQLQINMWTEGEPALERFMKGLTGTSTEVVVTFENLTVSYPGSIKKGISPRPIVTDMKFFFDEEHWALTQNVDFKPKSISILRKESAEMLTRELSHPFLSYCLQGSIESIWIEYLVETRQQVRAMMKVLHFITSFTPGAKLLSLPVSIIPKSHLITVEDLKNIKCAENLQVLWLDFNASQTLQDDPLGGLFLSDESIDFYSDIEETLVDRLPDFLDKVRCAFPNLTQLYLERAQVVYAVDARKISWAEDVVKKFEEATGVDASSLRQELRLWVKEERSENEDLEMLQAALEKLRAFQEARERNIASRIASGELDPNMFNTTGASSSTQ